MLSITDGQAIAEAAIEFLRERKGFSRWECTIAPDVWEELMDEMGQRMQEIGNKRRGLD